MNRRAILIAVSPPSNPIPSVYADIDLWRRFLCSSTGGVWTEQEIVTLRDCDRDEIFSAVSSAKDADYSLIIFAGHGRIVKDALPWAEAQLLLPSGDSMPERGMNPGTPSCVFIFDLSARTAEQQGDGTFTKYAAVDEREHDTARHRALYDKTIESAERGLVRIYAVGNHAANSSQPSFSQCLLSKATDWAKRNGGILSLQEGVLLATQAMAQINPQEKPEYLGGRRYRHFPLAVGA